MATRTMPAAIVAQGSARNQAVQVHMLAQVLAPGVEHGTHAHVAAKALGIATEGAQRLPGALEQQPVDHLGMQLNPAVEAVGQREHDMVVAHRQDIRLLTLGPLVHGAALALRTVAITTAEVVRLGVVAVRTREDHAAHRLGTTRQQVMAYPAALTIEAGQVKKAQQGLLEGGGLSHAPPPGTRPGR